MHKNFSILFYLKKPKNYTSGLLPVYMRITVQGQRAEISIQRQCLPEKWNSASGRMNGTKEDARTLNVYIDTLQQKLFEIHRELIITNSVITVETIKNKFTGHGEKPRMLMEIHQHHNKQFADLVGIEFAKGTLQKFQTCFATLQAFLKWKYSVQDIDVTTIGFEFVKDYEFYLKTIKSVSHNTAMGYIKKLKKIVRLCVANNWLDKDPFVSFKIKIKETHRAYLMEEELTILINKPILLTRLDQVRDIFLFSCFTGLAYCDVMKLIPLDIVKGIDGENWIFTNRIKTDTASRIPILPKAQEILDKYSDNKKTLISGKLLPQISNQKINAYLKEVNEICGFTKTLTFHCARHTFATTVTLTNGVPIETVSKMLGHKDLKTTQHYAKILDRKVSDDMKVLRERYTAQLTVLKTGSN